jgi:hypothetical protein
MKPTLPWETTIVTGASIKAFFAPCEHGICTRFR